MKKKAIKKIVSVVITLMLVLSIGISAVPLQNAYAASSSSGTWIKESNGRWWYKHKDGSYTKYDWEYIDGSWYFFDSNGWMWTEWLEWDGDWYYLNPNYIKNITQMNIYVPSILKLISVNKLKEQLIQVNNNKYVYDETPDNYFIDIYESGHENIYLNYIDNTIDIEIITDSDENTTTDVFNYTYKNNVITIYNPKHKHIHPEILNMFEYFGIQIKE